MSRIKYERGISFDQERKLYYLYMDIGRDAEGKRQRKYGTYATLTEARRARDFFIAQKAQSQLVPFSTMTLDEWLQIWMQDVVIPNRAETTVYAYRNIIRQHISPALGKIPLQALSPSDLQHYYAEMMGKKGLCGNTVRRHHDLLSAAFHSAMRQDRVLRSPTERVEPPRVIRKEARYYTAESLKKLYQLLDGHWLELSVHLAGSLGLRREEICGLKWDSVDFQLRKIYIRAARTVAGSKIIEKETKNRTSNRVLHMGDDVYLLLRKERGRQNELKLRLGPRWKGDGHVALNKQNEPMSPNRLTQSFTYFVRTHPQLPSLSFHGLRHTFATVASAQGVPLFDIGKALGHSTPDTTGKIYTHLVDQLHTDTIARVAAALQEG